MTDQDRRARAHDLDVTVWVGKRGIDAAVDELDEQLGDRDLVKVRFHRSSGANADLDSAAGDLANRVGAEVVETRGHTAVVHR
jgi:RNA-binding protein